MMASRPHLRQVVSQGVPGAWVSEDSCKPVNGPYCSQT